MRHGWDGNGNKQPLGHVSHLHLPLESPEPFSGNQEGMA